jgi:flagellar hook-basal body complex protein FliE
VTLIDPIGFLPPAAPTAPLWKELPPDLAAPPTHSVTGGVSFGEWFGSQLETVNAKVVASEKNLQALAAGETDNLHQVMLSLEEARLSFQLLAQVRTRLLESYQDLMRMQI